DMSPYEVVPMLLDQGRYICSVRTIYRPSGKEDLIHQRDGSKKRQKRAKPPQRIATGPNEVWCWDITWLAAAIKGLFFYAYVIIDIFDRSIVGWAVHDKESDVHSRDLFEMLSMGRDIIFGYLHSDNGFPMKGSTLMAFLDTLNVKVSFSRPRTSNDNPYIESLFRTIKYSSGYPIRFRDIEHAREWMADFVNWYNTEHLHSSIGYVTPEQLRDGSATDIFKNRNEVMQRAKLENPECWGSRETICWGSPEKVVLNPEKSKC
ncbi:MAG: integrase core domain-containing protein, partial [Candidatus Mariimomonas ferrooxydans]